MARAQGCTHKTLHDHSTVTHHFRITVERCPECAGKREVRFFKGGRARLKPCENCRECVEVRIWRCSVCQLAQRWSPSWSYIGNVECKKCWGAAIHAVSCSPACEAELRKKPRFAKLPDLDY